MVKKHCIYKYTVRKHQYTPRLVAALGFLPSFVIENREIPAAGFYSPYDHPVTQSAVYLKGLKSTDLNVLVSFFVDPPTDC